MGVCVALPTCAAGVGLDAMRSTVAAGGGVAALLGSAVAVDSERDGGDGVTVAAGVGSEPQPATPMASRRARQRRKRMVSTLPNPFDSGVGRLGPVT